MSRTGLPSDNTEGMIVRSHAKKNPSYRTAFVSCSFHHRHGQYRRVYCIERQGFQTKLFSNRIESGFPGCAIAAESLQTCMRERESVYGVSVRF